jgi:hypothetical protein
MPPLRLANEVVVTEGGPYAAVELEPSLPGAAPRRSRRSCHLRAMSSGHQRYAADSHGQFEEAGGLGPHL